MEALVGVGVHAAALSSASSCLSIISSSANNQQIGESRISTRSIGPMPHGCILCHHGSSLTKLPSSSASTSALSSSRRFTPATGFRPSVSSRMPKRMSFRSMATTDEIEAEKELVETDTMERMEKSLESLKGNFNSVRTGRASPALLDRIEVEYYGTPCGLKTIAQINTPDGSTLMIQPFDKSSLQNIEKALLQSDLGLTPNNDGTVIRLNIPQPTADRRKELLKTTAKLAEEAKVALRNVRRDAIKQYEKMEKADKLSEDNVRDLSVDIQKMTDEYVKKVDEMLKQKEKDILTV